MQEGVGVRRIVNSLLVRVGLPVKRRCMDDAKLTHWQAAGTWHGTWQLQQPAAKAAASWQQG